MNISEYLEVFVPTHIIDADTEKPVIKNAMLEETIVSCHNMLNLEDTKFIICPDDRFTVSHPLLMKKYKRHIVGLVERLNSRGINCVLRKKNSKTLRGNWKQFVEECKKPYMFFLEHDWAFLKKINTPEIIETFESEEKINYLRLPKYESTDNFCKNLASGENWDWIYDTNVNLNTKVPLTKISFFSGNPHFMRVSFCKNYLFPALDKYCPDHLAKGKSHLEKDIKKVAMRTIDEHRECGFSNRSTDKDSWGHQWPLSSYNSLGNGCLHCANAILRQQEIFGTYMYGNKGTKPVVDHIGKWCRKR